MVTGPRPENDLEITMRLVRSGELPSERLAPALLGAELVVLVDGTPNPTAIQPLVVHRQVIGEAIPASDRVAPTDEVLEEEIRQARSREPAPF